MKTRKSPRWYYEGRAILVLVLIITTLIYVGYQALCWVSDNVTSFN